MPELTRAEEELGQKWDRCLMDTLIKTGSGIGLGIVFSVVLFKRNLKTFQFLNDLFHWLLYSYWYNRKTISSYIR